MGVCIRTLTAFQLNFSPRGPVTCKVAFSASCQV